MVTGEFGRALARAQRLNDQRKGLHYPTGIDGGTNRIMRLTLATGDTKVVRLGDPYPSNVAVVDGSERWARFQSNCANPT